MNTIDNIIQPPTHCPICNSSLIENGEYIQCPNISNCAGQVAGRIKNWIKEIGILEWGETLIEKLVDTALVNDVADLYSLTVEDLSNLDRMGQRSAQKCIDNLRAANVVPLEVLLGGLSIPMIGQSTIKAIMNAGCQSLDSFMKCNAEDFEEVSGVGPTKAKSLYNGLNSNKELIMKMIENGVEIKEPKSADGKLAGKSFCFTGTLSIKRAVAEQMVEENGGEAKSSIVSGLTYLVLADPNSNSTKTQKAKKMGVKLLSEAQFLAMVE